MRSRWPRFNRMVEAMELVLALGRADAIARAEEITAFFDPEIGPGTTRPADRSA